jgi:hypothetical protein
MYEPRTGKPDVADTARLVGQPTHHSAALAPLRAMQWRDGAVVHACEALLLTESIRTSVIITACGKAPPDDQVVCSTENDPPVDCRLCLWHLARV